LDFSPPLFPVFEERAEEIHTHRVEHSMISSFITEPQPNELLFHYICNVTLFTCKENQIILPCVFIQEECEVCEPFLQTCLFCDGFERLGWSC